MFEKIDLKNTPYFKAYTWGAKIILKNIDKVLYILLFLTVIKVLIFALFHNPNFSYDESNTINIATTSVKDIYLLLNNEHNFTGYYYILYFLQIFGDISVIAKIFNFIVWLLSIFFFYKLSAYYQKNNNLRLLYTLIFTLTPTVYYYAFYIRMYGLMILLFIVFLIFLNKYLENKKAELLFIAGGCLLLLSFIHPTTVFICTPLVILIFNDTLRVKHKIYLLIVLSIPNLLILAQLYLKANFLKTYFGNNAFYVNAFNSSFIENITLIFNLLPHFSYFLYLTLLISFFLLIKEFNKNILYKMITAYLLGILLVIHTAKYITPRHYVFFVIPILISFLAVSNRKYKKYLKIFHATILFCFVISSLSFDKFIINTEIKHISFCNVVKKLNKPINIITDYAVINPITQCLKNEEIASLIVVDSEIGAVNLTQKKPLEKLYYQSTRGGTSTIITLRGMKSIYLELNTRPEVGTEKSVKEIREMLQNNKINNFYYMTRYEFTPSQNFFSSDEFRMFDKFKMNKYTSPSIFEMQKL